MRRALLGVLALCAAGCKPWANEDLTALDTAPAYKAMSAGMDRTCGLGADGKAFCWGQSVIGTLLATDLCYELPDFAGYAPPPAECIKRPIRVSGNHQFTTIVSGANQMLAIDASGAIWAWGGNSYGVISQTNLDSTMFYPRQVAGTATWKFKSVAAGLSTACGVIEDGKLVCWGERNFVTARVYSLSPCAGGFRQCVVAPAQIGTGTSWKQVTVGNEHACALDNAGVVSCWGAGQRGQQGSTGLATCPSGTGLTLACRLDPGPISGSTLFTAISAAGDATCGTSTLGVVWCWGTGVFGTSSTTASVPSQIGAFTNWTNVAIGVGGTSACGLRSGGTWWCFGSGQVGAGPSPHQVNGAPALAGVVVGDDHACGWTASGDAWCFGDRHYGAVGDGSVANTFATTPIQVSLPYRD